MILRFPLNLDVICNKYNLFLVLIYTVEIYTGDLPGSATSAEAYIHLNGCRGDSGQRLLFKPLTENKKPFQEGQCDVYEIEAVSLDEIESVIIGHNGHGKGK